MHTTCDVYGDVESGCMFMLLMYFKAPRDMCLVDIINITKKYYQFQLFGFLNCLNKRTK